MGYSFVTVLFIFMTLRILATIFNVECGCNNNNLFNCGMSLFIFGIGIETRHSELASNYVCEHIE